jgi:peptide/nickel transport system substrate-binding protein
MENRFGFKDFFLILLIVIVIIMLGLAMKQYDRQYQLVLELRDQGHDQLQELEAIHRDLQGGGGFGSTSQPSFAELNQGEDPFPSLRALRNEGKYNEGDWFVQNFGEQVGKVTPLIAGDAYAYALQARILETLAYQDADTLKFAPLLATSWAISDNTKAWHQYVDGRLRDGKTEEDVGGEADCPPAVAIDFKLRHGVTFSDGSPFTADDVVFTYDWIMNPKVDAPRDRQSLHQVKSVEKVNDYEVVFNFKVPYYLAFITAAEQEILSKKFYGSYTPEQFNDSVGLLMGTGPYRLPSPTDWKPTTGRVELFRNERYWGLSPSFNRLVFHQVENETTSLVMYGNGELDAIGLTPEQYDLVKVKPEIMDKSQLMIYSSPLTGYDFIGWNQARNGKPTIFADRRVRQAMTMLTDRDGMCKSIFRGFATPAPGPFEGSSPRHDPSLVDWQYDPAKAKALLKEVGIEDRTGNGVMTLPDGKPFSFKLTYPTKVETIDRMMQYIRDNYARAGIDMELDPVDWTIMDQRLKGQQFDAISLAWGGGTIEDDIRQMFHSSQIKDQGDNFVSYDSPQFDAALVDTEHTLDDDARMKKWQLCEKILHDDQPYTFLSNGKSIRLFDKRIKNIHLAKTGLNYVSDWVMPIPWYVPAAEQKYKQ